jgi:hypothetical protein
MSRIDGFRLDSIFWYQCLVSFKIIYNMQAHVLELPIIYHNSKIQLKEATILPPPLNI